MVESLHSDTRERHIGGPRLLEQPRSHRGAGGAERVVVGLVGAAHLERAHESASGVAEVILQQFACGARTDVGLDVRVTYMYYRHRAVAAGKKSVA